MAQSGSRNRLMEEDMLERAAGLFAERGFSGTTLEEIARAMGLSRPALYYYVASKEDLIAKLVQGISRETADEFAALRKDENREPSEKLRAAVKTLAVRIANNPARFRLLLSSEATLPETLAKEHLAARREILEHFSAIIGDGVEAGVLKPVDERVAAFATLGMCNWIAWWFRADGRLSAEEVASIVSNIALDGMGTTDARLLAKDGDGVSHTLNLLKEDIGHLERMLR